MAASVLASCAHSPLVWDYYDQCALQNPSFLAMAECGRQKRLAACVPNDTCSPEGTTFMEYVDTLAVSVKTKKLTESRSYAALHRIQVRWNEIVPQIDQIRVQLRGVLEKQLPHLNAG
jgi:hypothetical protein